MLMLKVGVLAFAAVCSAQVLPKSAPFVTSNDGILNLPVSSDLKCGPKAKTICPDDLCCSEYGVCNRETDSCKGSLCCSDRGYCGVDVSHCVAQCDPLYGECGNDLSPAIKASLTLTDDNTCGRRVNKVCPPESCCSRDGECGTTTAHCSVGCQGLFGICKLPITKLPEFDSSPAEFDYYRRVRKTGGLGGHIALAFDGGTDVHNVPKILDVLKELGARATFFVSGFKTSNLYDSEVQAIVKRICDEGHQVGSGSLSYSKLNGISPEEVALEMLNNDWMIQNVIGASPIYMRLPYSHTSPEVIRQLMDMGYIVVGSNLNSGDLRIGDVDDSGEAMLASFDQGRGDFPMSNIEVESLITLNHEDVKNGHLGIRKIIEKYSGFGFKFVTVGESLRQPDPQSWYRIRDFNEFA
ncbi:hypothetical protein BATDEDRAFT_26600 [Batrachochytrium dendrobatidis JAM81]|uniref:NodB homology domain-containing protein n=1 Tax=Batrachochytrium dendrobatidis (strain JAM81 / FGSC 10211) TaxID=684364 RepID=F4P8N3_BATDJ|nr:uncharacterized protein BATDEDRAFT_26600 [Batrachochytrium dendrobatidis JAM81]EGF78702.1 hypothetical protein BATDEDRAFT_26600 [Batrachochytrium dendrobatidis JAM81]|eukprot:XP_006680710.1 hypothetical protein BATDEDRAFT_26600 [Batrachochytrium dendrobatidis JAM81]